MPLPFIFVVYTHNPINMYFKRSIKECCWLGYYCQCSFYFILDMSITLGVPWHKIPLICQTCYAFHIYTFFLTLWQVSLDLMQIVSADMMVTPISSFSWHAVEATSLKPSITSVCEEVWSGRGFMLLCFCLMYLWGEQWCMCTWFMAYRGFQHVG